MKKEYAILLVGAGFCVVGGVLLDIFNLNYTSSVFLGPGVFTLFAAPLIIDDEK